MNSLDINTDHYIAGAWEPSSVATPVTSPIDGKVIGEVPEATPEQVDRAVSAARSAFPAWSLRPLGERLHLVRKFGEHIAAHRQKFASVESEDTGFLLAHCETGVLSRAVENFRYFADFAEDASHRSHCLSGTGADNYVEYRPAGVAVIIVPWNAPLILATFKIAAALAAGNTVVLKPAELAPLSCALLAESAHAVGLPPGVFNVLHGCGASVGAALAAHPDIDRLAFTGSTATARSIGASCAESITPVSFELGGKSPLVVCADSDLEAACRHVVGQFNHAGQICAAGTRVIVEAAIEPAFRQAVIRAVPKQAIVGDPRISGTTVGPLISEAQLAKVEGMVDRAKMYGCSVLCGGKRIVSAGGHYYEPTILSGAALDSEIYQQEIFGPVLVWSSFVGDDDAIQQANCTQYGLAAYLWCADERRARSLAGRIRAGTVWVNGFTRDLAAPFGGAGQSGIGREGGMWSWEFFSEVVNVAVTRGAFPRRE